MSILYNINSSNFNKLMESDLDIKFATELASYYTRTKFLDGIYYLCNKYNIRLSSEDLSNIIKFEYNDTKILKYCNFDEDNMLCAIEYNNIKFVEDLCNYLHNYNLYFHHAAKKGNAKILMILDRGEVQYFNALLNAVDNGDFDTVDYIINKIKIIDDVESRMLTRRISSKFDRNLIIHLKLKGIQLNSSGIKSYFGNDINPLV